MGHIIGMAGHLEENLERIEAIPWSVVRAAQLAACGRSRWWNAVVSGTVIALMP